MKKIILTMALIMGMSAIFAAASKTTKECSDSCKPMEHKHEKYENKDFRNKGNFPRGFFKRNHNHAKPDKLPKEVLLVRQARENFAKNPTKENRIELKKAYSKMFDLGEKRAKERIKNMKKEIKILEERIENAKNNKEKIIEEKIEYFEKKLKDNKK